MFVGHSVTALLVWLVWFTVDLSSHRSSLTSLKRSTVLLTSRYPSYKRAHCCVCSGTHSVVMMMHTVYRHTPVSHAVTFSVVYELSYVMNM